MKFYDTKGKEIPASRLARASVPSEVAATYTTGYDSPQSILVGWAHCETRGEWQTPSDGWAVEVAGQGPDQGDEMETYLQWVGRGAAARAAQLAILLAAGQAEAARLNALLAAAGVRRDIIEVSFSTFYVGQGPTLHTAGGRDVTPEQVERLIPHYLEKQVEWDAEAARLELVASREAAIKSWAAEAGVTCGSMVAWQGEWASHEESFGGLAGGDFEEGVSWKWAGWVQAILDTVTGGAEVVTAACVAWHAAEEEAAQAAREARAREISIREAAVKAAKLAELAAAGLRADAAERAMVSAVAEKRERDLLQVRRSWGKLLRYSPGSGGYRALGPDAQALLERVRAASGKAMSLRAARESRERAADAECRTRAEAAAAQAAAAKKAAFIGGSGWGALDALKF